MLSNPDKENTNLSQCPGPACDPVPGLRLPLHTAVPHTHSHHTPGPPPGTWSWCGSQAGSKLLAELGCTGQSGEVEILWVLILWELLLVCHLGHQL